METISLYRQLSLKKNDNTLIFKIVIVVVLFGLMFLNNQYQAQIYQTSVFDSIKVIPANPHTTDYIKLISYTAQRSSPCYFDSSKVIDQPNIVNATFYYRAYGFLAEYIMIDTVDLGYLIPGVYNLNADLLTFSYTDTIVDSIAMEFTVTRGDVGLKEESKFISLNLYPNPVNNQLNFTLTDIFNTIKLEVLDVTGKRVKVESYTNKGDGEFKNSIDVSDLKNGLYFCRFSNGEKQVTRKFVKQ